MESQSQSEFIIVGGGLAGLMLAWELQKKGKSFFLFADKNPCSSNVAAGTWNPVTFRTLRPTWRAQEMLDALKETYEEIDNALNSSFLKWVKVEKILANEEEKEFWEKSAMNDISIPFLESETQTKNLENGERISGFVKQTGRLDLPEMVSALRAYFLESGHLVEESFNHSELQVSGEGINYKNYFAEKIVFAEGSYVKNNSFFNWLPFRPVNGNVLTIVSKELKVETILKKNIFILPVGNNTYKVGATYDWSDTTWEPSDKARGEILSKLEKVITVPYQIVDQKAGIRPATFDRRPFIGAHPIKNNVYIFNGLGAKGVFLAPLLVKEFSDYLFNNGSICPEVDIKRCMKKYWKES